MAGDAELAGARGPADSKHHSSKGKRQENEELTADSPRVLARTKRGQGARAVVGNECGLGEIRTSAFVAARAQTLWWKQKATCGRRC